MALKRIPALLAGMALSATGIVSVSTAAVADDTCTGPKHISLIGVTDFHGHIENATKVAQALADKRAENPNTLFVSAGDNVGASAFESSVAQDNPTMDIMKEMGLAVSAVGNHEFDNGGADLINRIMPRIGAPYIASNIGGTVPDPVNGGTVSIKDNIAPYYITEVDGVKLGFVGAVTETLPAAISPTLNKGLEVENLAAAVNKYADQLKDGNEANGEADVVIVLAHEDGDHTASVLTSQSIDALLSGHTHLNQKGTTAGGAPYVEAENFGNAYSKLEITVPCEGKPTVQADVVQTADIQPDTTNPLVSTVQGLYNDAIGYAEEQGSRVIGCLAPGSTFHRGAIVPDTKSSEGGNENRGIQSRLGQLEADIALWTANQNLSEPVDIGFINSGGLRTDLDAGGSVSTANDGLITLEEARNVTPFGNTNAVVTLTGALLKKALEQQWQPIGARRPVLWLGTSSNVTYNYIPYAIDEAGNRYDEWSVNEENQYVAADGTLLYPRGEVIDLKVNGQPVKDTDTFRVAGNSFLLAGGDDFGAFLEGTDYVDTGYVDIDGVIDYFTEFTSVENGQCVKGLTAPAVRNTAGLRALKVDEATGTAEVEVSGLTFSTDEPVPAGAYVSVNGVPLGYFEGIERQPVPTLTPEMGTLTASATGLCKAALDQLTSADGKIVTAEVVLGERTDELDRSFNVDEGICKVDPVPVPDDPTPVPDDPTPVPDDPTPGPDAPTAAPTVAPTGIPTAAPAVIPGGSSAIPAPTITPTARVALSTTGASTGLAILGSVVFTLGGLMVLRRRTA